MSYLAFFTDPGVLFYGGLIIFIGVLLTRFSLWQVGQRLAARLFAGERPFQDPVSGALGPDTVAANSLAAEPEAGETPPPAPPAFHLPGVERPGPSRWDARRRPAGEQQPADEEFFSFLAEYTTGIISKHAPDGSCLYASPAFHTLLGFQPGELAGRPLPDMVHPEDLPLLSKFFLAEAEAPDRFTVSYRLRCQDGRYLWVETTGKRITDPVTGLLAEVIGISHEITERKQAELELIQRNRELTILQSAGVVITSSLDLRYVLDTVTREMANLLDVESCTIAEWRRSEGALNRMAKYGAEGWWDPAVLTNIHSLDNYPLTRWVLEEQIPTQMALDQDTLDPAEAAYMRAHNIKTRLILPMIYHKNVVGLVELEDSRAARTFTYQEISMARLLANQAASALENARLYEEVQQELLERQRAEAALLEERALLARRVDERTADLSRANAELARAARLKDEFLANVSHELRTPLNTILGSSEIVRAGTFGEVNDRQVKYLRNIEESGRHLLSLINDILDLSKAEVGKLELDTRPVSVVAVCEASLRLVRQLATKKQIQLSSSLPNLAGVTLLADELRLKQILVNLLSNAIKFTPEGGRIGLEVVGDIGRQGIYFTVWDTGIGISPENMNRLFKPFIQLESNLNRQYAGTGLGLSLVARMAELHGGSVSVESDGILGHGSRFTVALPWTGQVHRPKRPVETPSVDTALPKPAFSWPQDRPPLILLAEDNESNIETLQDYLESQGYRLRVARNGEEALESARETKPDLILMDIQMPGMDGLEATRRLRLDPVFEVVPIIALTALARPGDRQRCLDAGANDYLSKPLHLKGLLQVIETCLISPPQPRKDLP